MENFRGKLLFARVVMGLSLCLYGMKGRVEDRYDTTAHSNDWLSIVKSVEYPDSRMPSRRHELFTNLSYKDSDSKAVSWPLPYTLVTAVTQFKNEKEFPIFNDVYLVPNEGGKEFVKARLREKIRASEGRSLAAKIDYSGNGPKNVLFPKEWENGSRDVTVYSDLEFLQHQYKDSSEWPLPYMAVSAITFLKDHGFRMRFPQITSSIMYRYTDANQMRQKMFEPPNHTQENYLSNVVKAFGIMRPGGLYVHTN